jgi:UDP-2-acetamido-3-amino-2,3-dideoxy-glucuronate N-acetyltransferase
MSIQVHPSSIIEPSAQIGEGTKIWHFCHVDRNANIGRNCTLGQGCYVGPGVSIGNNVKIQNNVSVFEGVVIQDDAFIGPSVVFTNVNFPRAFKKSEKYVLTVVDKGASIGANATIICGNTIGAYAFVGAGSVVTKSVEPNTLVYGVPAVVHGWLDAQGEYQCRK